MLAYSRINGMLSIVLFIGLLIVPISDFISVYGRYNDINALERFSLVFRLILMILALVLALNYRSWRKNTVFFVFLFGALSVVTNFFVVDGVDLSLLFETMLFLLKYFLFFLYLYAFKYIIDNNVISFDKFEKYFSLVIFSYAFFIVYGAFSGSEIFHNYLETERWGVKGIIIAGNEASGFLLIAIFWALIDTSSRMKFCSFVIIALACLLSGTKASMLSLVFATFCYFIIKYRALGVLISLLAAFFLFLITVVMYYSLPAVQENIDNNIAYFVWHFDNTANDNFFNLALTGRDYKFSFVFSELMSYSPWSLVVGGYPVGLYQVEMDFFDLVTLLGIFFTILYVYLWFSSWGSFFKTDLNLFKLAFCISFFVLGFLAGHFYNSAMAAPLAAALCIRFIFLDKQRNISARKNNN